MIPSCGPVATGSRAEQLIYHLLKDQLGEDFTVIHSLPWLCAAVRELVGGRAVTGEIDFVIVHSRLGVLAAEVKGGAHRVQGLAFVHVHSGNTTRAVEQIRTSTHGLARWLGVKPGLRLKIGYALIFPDSDFNGEVVSLALTDVTVDPPQTIVIDRKGLPEIGTRIAEIMGYWMTALGSPALGEERRSALVNELCPSFDGTPSWGSRVVWDEKIWLRLTPEQSAVVDDALSGHRMVITGWPGTGKTLILIASARHLLKEGKRVLVLTFNSLLAQHIREQTGSSGRLRVATWHSFCASSATRSRSCESDQKWLEDGCLADIQHAARSGQIQPFDVLLVDEAQTFRTEWFEWMCDWHGNGQLIAFCDETQVFAFEQGRVALPRLCDLVGTEKPFALTTVLRSPRAVYQRLKSVKKSDYQLHMPRELEVDTLRELLVVGISESLSKTLAMLAEEGVSGSDVVVLNKYGWVPGGGEPRETVRHQTLSRFRGMESPVVVISSAEQMDDAELFCAYSRATSLCIALYDAEVLGVKGPGCPFQVTVMADPGNLEQASSARLKAQTGEIIAANLAPLWLGLNSVQLGWLDEWGAWLVVDRNELSRYWIDFIASQYPWPIYYWQESSLREIHRGEPLVDAATGSPGSTPHNLRPCGACSNITPQRLDAPTRSEAWRCAVCDDDASTRECPDGSIIEEIRMLDRLLMVDNPKALTEKERKSLPLSLAAGAALTFAKRNSSQNPVGFDQVAGGRVAYHAAAGFVCSLGNLLPPGKTIRVADIAKELYERYLTPRELTFEVWKRDFSQACAVAKNRGYLEKIEKGVYAVKRA